jgi:NADH-quinone oxidoreductase subunit E
VDDPREQATQPFNQDGAENEAAAIFGRTSAVLARYPQGDTGNLVNVLHDLQSEFRYLPEQALRQVGRHLGMPASAVFGVASFYQSFHTSPRGEHTCTVCMGTACHVRGASRLLEQVERDAGVTAGGTTADRRLTVEEVNCVGACALGPLVLIDGEYHGHMTADQLSRLVGPLLKKDAAE